MDQTFSLQKRATLAKALRDAKAVGIVVGSSHSVDIMGSALALYLALTQSNKNTQIVSPKQPLVEISHLFGVNKVR